MTLPVVKYRNNDMECSVSILYSDESKVEAAWIKHEKKLAIAHYPANSDEADNQIILGLPEAKELKKFLNLPEMQEPLA